VAHKRGSLVCFDAQAPAPPKIRVPLRRDHRHWIQEGDAHRGSRYWRRSNILGVHATPCSGHGLIRSTWKTSPSHHPPHGPAFCARHCVRAPRELSELERDREPQRLPVRIRRHILTVCRRTQTYPGHASGEAVRLCHGHPDGQLRQRHLEQFTAAFHHCPTFSATD